MGHASFPKLWLIKLLRKFIRELIGRKSFTKELIAEVMVTLVMKSTISRIVETCFICIMTSSNIRHPPTHTHCQKPSNKAYSNQRDISWIRLAN